QRHRPNRYLPSFPTRRSSDLRMKVPYCATVGKSKRRANTVSAGKRSMNRGRSLRRSVLRYPFHDVHLATEGPAGGMDVRSKKPRSEEHTSELQSRENLVCRLL